MNAAIAMVISATSILVGSLYIAVAGIESLDFESGIDFKRWISAPQTTSGKPKKKKKKKSR